MSQVEIEIAENKFFVVVLKSRVHLYYFSSAQVACRPPAEDSQFGAIALFPLLTLSMISCLVSADICWDNFGGYTPSPKAILP